MQDKPTFIPTKPMLDAATAVFVAEAAVATIRPVVTSYENAILQAGQWHIDQKWADTAGDGVILDPAISYLMSEKDFESYRAQCGVAQDRAGLNIGVDVSEAGQCPLLLAQAKLEEAKRTLVRAMADTTQATLEGLMSVGPSVYEEYVELALRLLTPHLKSATAIYAIRDLAIARLTEKGAVEVADLQTLDRVGRFRVADELWAQCTPTAREALLHDESGTVSGTPVVFMVDTGATTVSISSAIAVRAGIPRCEPHPVSTANGTTSGCAAVVPELSFGGFRLTNVKVDIMSAMPGDALLGMNVLSRFRMEQVDGVMRITANQPGG